MKGQGKKCKGCGAEVDRKKVYCSRDCYWASNKKPSYVCEGCGKSFTRVGQRQNKFCSSDCYNSVRSRQATVTRLIQCEACGEPFKAKKPGLKCCSRQCRHNLDRTTFANCERCGERFCNKQGKLKYCSEECRRPAVHIECASCKKQLRVEPGDLDRRFCSVACYRKFTGETSLEKLVRTSLERLGYQFSQEFKIGRRSVDFAFPAFKVCIEADGDYWHSDRSKDDAKDRYLTKYGWKVVRVRESEAIGSEDLDQLISDRLSQFLAPESLKLKGADLIAQLHLY